MRKPFKLYLTEDARAKLEREANRSGYTMSTVASLTFSKFLPLESGSLLPDKKTKIGPPRRPGRPKKPRPAPVPAPAAAEEVNHDADFNYYG